MRANADTIQGSVPRNDINFHHKRDSLNVIPQILDEKIVKNIIR